MNCREAPALVVNETHDAAAAAAPTTARSPLEKSLSELTEEDIAQVTREDCRRFLKERGHTSPFSPPISDPLYSTVQALEASSLPCLCLISLILPRMNDTWPFVQG